MSDRDLAALEKRLREEPENLGLRVMLAGQLLEAGDAAKVDAQEALRVEALEQAELLLFDLPTTYIDTENTH